MNTYRSGIDIGSTTVKLVVLTNRTTSFSAHTGATALTRRKRSVRFCRRRRLRSAAARCR